MGKRNNRQFFGLLKQVYQGMDQAEAKSLLCGQISRGRTDSLRELTDAEYDEAIAWMIKQVKMGTEQVLREARSASLKQLQIYGVDTTKWTAVNAFVSQSRIAGKVFYELSVTELKQLTQKMRAINAKKMVVPRQSSLKEPREDELIWVKNKSGRKVYIN